MPTVLGPARNAAIDRCLREEAEADAAYEKGLRELDEENARELKRLKPDSPAYLAREARQKIARELIERHHRDRTVDAKRRRDKTIREIDGVIVGGPA